MQILHWIMCILMVFGSDQSDELSMLNDDNGSIAIYFWIGLTVQLEYFNHSVVSYNTLAHLSYH